METHMRTLIDIQDDLLEDLLKASGTSVKKDAIILAIKTFLDVRRREKLAALIGNYDFSYSLKDLEKMRKNG
jgi:Arc/MetJ family transcription regulator